MQGGYFTGFLCCKKQKKTWLLPIEQLRLSQRSQETHVLSASSDQLFQVITRGWIDLSREGFNCWVFSQRTVQAVWLFFFKNTNQMVCLFVFLFVLFVCLFCFFCLCFPLGKSPVDLLFFQKQQCFYNSELGSSSLLPCATTTGTSWISS